jgi:hypothetical protein
MMPLGSCNAFTFARILQTAVNGGDVSVRLAANGAVAKTTGAGFPLRLPQSIT